MLNDTNKAADILVATDALIEGRGEAAELCANRARADVYELCLELANLVADKKHAKFPTLSRDTVRLSVGRAYIKLIVGGSVWAMVSRTDGLVWSSMCGKPVRNYPRGCVHDAESRANLSNLCFGIAGSGAYHDLG